MVAELAIGGLTWLAAKAEASAPGVVTGVVSGVLGNVSDRSLCGLLRGFSDRLSGGFALPENHDLAKALRVAQLHAVEQVVSDYERTHSRHLIAQTDSFIQRVKEFCKDTVGRCLDWKTKLPKITVTEALQNAVTAILAQPVAESPDERAAEIRKLAEDAVLAELRAVVTPLEMPEDFVSHFRDGLGDNDRFLDLFGVYVAEQLKNNAPFRAIFVAGQLSRIEASGFEGRALVERLENLFSAKLGALDESVRAVGQRQEVIEVAIRGNTLSLDALKAGVDRLIADSQTGAADVQVVLARLGEVTTAMNLLPERLATVIDQHTRFRSAQISRSRTAHRKSSPRFLQEESPAARIVERFETLDDIAGWLTKDHFERWSSVWLESLNALRTQGEIGPDDFGRVFTHVAGTPLPHDTSWVSLEGELQSQGALSRSLMQVSTSALHDSLRLARGAGRLVQILSALRLGVRTSVTVRGVEFVMIPPGSLVTSGASTPQVNYTAYFISRSPIDRREWNQICGAAADCAGLEAEPKTLVSITDVHHATETFDTPRSVGTTELPAADELLFAFEADAVSGLGLLHPVPQLWHLCSKGHRTDQFEVVRPSTHSSSCRLDWPSDAARHRDVGVRLVFRPRLERI